MTARFDLCGIGNAIVDVVAPTEDRFLSHHDMRKGGMALVDAAAADAIYAAMPPGQESSGGSVANSCAVAALLGSRVAYLGKVADDQLGAVFRHDIAAVGVHFPTPSLAADQAGAAPTARCLILVTPDGQRTMNTFLGACVTFGPQDLDHAVIAASAVTYLEGYLFDPPAAQGAFIEAARMARAAGQRTALSLSDAFCVDRHRAQFRRLVAQGVDVLFANEAEICSLYARSDFAEAAADVAREVPLSVLTRSEAGSVILHEGAQIKVPAMPVRVLDTTGAGDAYAAGFLAALTKGESLADAGVLGARAAALAIGQMGARPPREDLRALLG